MINTDYGPHYGYLILEDGTNIGLTEPAAWWDDYEYNFLRAQDRVGASYA